MPKKEESSKEKPKKKKKKASDPGVKVALKNLKVLKSRQKELQKDMQRAEDLLTETLDDDPETNPYKEEEIAISLEQLNHSELVAICRQRGWGNASRDIPSEVLIQVLKEEEDPDIIGDPIDKYRRAIEKFLKDYPSVVSQLRCDQNHAACPPARVIECFGSAPEIKDYAKGS